jgi:hypothetical protein
LTVTDRWLSLLLIIGLLSGCVTTGPAVPTSFHGFVGSVEGRVLSVHRSSFVLLIEEIKQIRGDNRAPRPASARGREFVVNAAVTTNRFGQRSPVSSHRAFINSLSTGENVTVRVRHTSGAQLELLELTADQRNRGR